MKHRAEAMWSKAEGVPVKTSIVRILNNGDRSAVVYFRNTFLENRVALSKHVAVFAGQSGAVLQDFAKPPIGEASAWVRGAHFMQFGHWPLRWLHFLGGLGGCVMIAIRSAPSGTFANRPPRNSRTCRSHSGKRIAHPHRLRRTATLQASPTHTEMFAMRFRHFELTIEHEGGVMDERVLPRYRFAA